MFDQPVSMRRVIAGAIYDFAARLTCREQPITLGATHDAAPAAEACNEFLKLRGCDEGEPLVREWQLAIGGRPGLNLTTPEAFAVLRAAIKEDSGYAWSWHCNVAMAANDEGMEHEAANRAAARFMKLCFDVDTTAPPVSSAVREA